MKTIFLSHVLSAETPGFGGKLAFEVDVIKSMTRGDSCNESRWHMSNHVGTHVDVPFHFAEAGDTVERFEAADWIFERPFLAEVQVALGSLVEDGEWTNAIPKDCDLLLLRTGSESTRGDQVYWSANPGLAPSLGQWLRLNRPDLRAIGFDFISATSFLHR
ncbi:MAG: cyclase family protein, partial [Bdellovibrionota bacterium]